MRAPLLGLALLVLSACAQIPAPAERLAHAESLATAHGWRRFEIPAGLFVLATWQPAQVSPDARLTVYIEGDGLAWIGRSIASADPTPGDPLALRLALAQPRGNAAYLARPCQFTDAEATGCDPAWWTGRRFSAEVVAATGQAIDALKQRFNARKLTLVGYSGGGAVAALVAARRQDVDRLVTVAGNLDHREWTTRHAVLPLEGSLNPADEVAALERVQQWHWVGGRDRVIPPELAQSFAGRFPPGRRPEVILEAEFDHRCCWVEQWPALWNRLETKSLTRPPSAPNVD